MRSPGESSFKGHWSQMSRIAKGLGKDEEAEKELPPPRSQ